MPRNTSVTIGNHFESFIAEQLKDGRFGSASEVVRAGLRLLEEREIRVRRLRAALIEGEESGFVEYEPANVYEQLGLNLVARFRLSAKADTDLRSIAAYTEKQWGRRQRDTYIRELFEAFANLAESPEIAQRIDEIRQGYRKFPQGAHVIFFRHSDAHGMEIIRILHNRMDAESHLGSP